LVLHRDKTFALSLVTAMKYTFLFQLI